MAGGSSNPRFLTPVGADHLYFTADGSIRVCCSKEALLDLETPLSIFDGILVLEDIANFFSQDFLKFGLGRELYRTDGTFFGTQLMADDGWYEWVRAHWPFPVDTTFIDKSTCGHHNNDRTTSNDLNPPVCQASKPSCCLFASFTAN